MDSKQTRALARGDLTTGSPAKKIILFCLPLLGGNIFSQLYNVVDSIVVGNYEGAEALAAVGASFTVFMLIHSMLMGLGTGSSVVIAQYFGAKQYKELSRAVGTTLISGLVLGVFLTVLGLFIARPVLVLLNTPENIIDDSALYLRITFYGTIGQMLYFQSSAIMRGIGDSKTPMYFLIVCALLNIVLDLLFVIKLGMGVAGVAWATIISQSLSGICMLIRVFTSGVVRLSRETMTVDFGKLKHIARIGVPGALQMACSSLGMMIIQSYGNSFGSDFVATNSIVQKVDGFAQMPAMAFSTALTTYVGQNIGAGREDRVKKGVRFTILASIVVGIVIGIAMVLFGKNIVYLFVSDNETVLKMCLTGLTIMACGYWAMGVQQGFAGTLRGAGAAMVPMIVMVASTFIRIPIAYLLAIIPGDYRGMFYALLLSFVFGAICMVAYYLSGRWKGKAVTKANMMAAEELETEAMRENEGV